jgi:IclR family KDG regulon transcriptional repressor
MTSNEGDAYSIRAIDRAIDILTSFSEESPTLSLSEVADRANLSKPTAFRILSSLRHRGFITQDTERGDYALGYEIVALAGVRRRQTKVWEVAMPFMRRVRDAVDETVLLCIRTGNERYILDQVESTQPIRRVAKIGERVPLYAGAASRILLAAMTETEIDEYLRTTTLERLGPATFTDERRLRKELASVRQSGYAIGHNERNHGGSGLAVGVRDHTGDTVAALQVTVPTERWNAEVRRNVISVLMETSHELSMQLGDRTPPRAFKIADQPRPARKKSTPRKAAASTTRKPATRKTGVE